MTVPPVLSFAAGVAALEREHQCARVIPSGILSDEVLYELGAPTEEVTVVLCGPHARHAAVVDRAGTILVEGPIT